MLVTFTELLPLDSPASNPDSSAPCPSDGTGSGAALHCGTAMDLVTPAVGPAAVGYSFEPEGGGPVQLPPVWRCGCGFQLDAWIRSPYARASRAGAAVQDAPHSAALSA
ncbi:hypothetical protein GCM10011577_21240 [Pseudarthrobacter polychromogenes]|uniref:Uncharacterized protein n=2 Tax=Micrococcaceae TaxID=1268 RepID=A0ABQ1XMF6_9MICC|nr:hypothetical protein GCM10011577_21240 [Pseudarthrobacter polychromogenes]